jgi:chemotaxis protein CheD
VTAAALASAAPDARERRIHVVQGEFVVADDPEVMLTTVLGSCIAACIRDPVAGVGGMNHFLLPGSTDSEGLRYGVNAMELLVNGLLQRGARRDRLEAKLFGGGRLTPSLADVGALNADFARAFLADEGIAFTGGSTGGRQARRLQFWPVNGRSRQLYVSGAEALREADPAPAPPVPASDGGVELF